MPWVALVATKGKKALADLRQRFDVHPNQIDQWRSPYFQEAAGVIGSEAKSEAAAPAIDVKTLTGMRPTASAQRSEAGAGERFLAGPLGKPGLLSAKR